MEGNTKEDVTGEQYLMEKRGTRDKRIVPEIVPSKSTKRGNTSNEDGTKIGRPNKKRKFILIGETWGKRRETERGEKRRVQLSMEQSVHKKKRGDTDTGDNGNLYDTANNLSMIREMRGDCVIKNRYCQEHGQCARKVTMKKDTWTRNTKTGLYGYRIRKVSVL